MGHVSKPTLCTQITFRYCRYELEKRESRPLAFSMTARAALASMRCGASMASRVHFAGFWAGAVDLSLIHI